ncbi:hypothetical protein [Paenibacillus sp. XY044]|uniref:hypothetical protein n=1 Tax=Paenibacillus sp. XY044 TaxID=2026089 RepID=UPI000B99C7F2|nr:hypothetical protein [Paenibacillus sp. XY044]OZB95895.1 hypothetical protein CJP46_08105 [Paenibacillus sp. XY044]
MIPIYPLTEENIRQHCGKMVAACMYDGRVFTGKLTECKDGHIILNGPENTTLHGAKVKGRHKNRVKGPVAKAPQKASIRAFYPYGYGFGYGAGLALGLATLGLLFLI